MPKIADFYAELGLKKDKFDKGMNDAGQAPSKLAGAFGALGGAITAAFSIGAIVAFGDAAMKAWDAQEKANAGLLQALKGRKDLQEALLQQASDLQRTTLFEDDAIVQAQKMLAVMGLSVSQIKDLIPLIADFSTATGMDLAQAANLAGKAIGTGTNALGRYGVELDSTMSKTEKANEIMAVFTERYGNQAEKAAKAGASGLQQLNKAWGEIKETIGSKIGPFIAAMAQLLAGKGFEATTGAAATGIQKTINDYINADADGREKIQKGLEWSLKTYNETYKKAKDELRQEDASYAAGQADVVRETLEKIQQINEQSNAQIVDDTEQSAKEIKDIWVDLIGVVNRDYDFISQMQSKGFKPDGVSTLGQQSGFTGGEFSPVFFDYEKFVEDLDRGIEAFTNFKNEIAQLVREFIADSIVTLFEALGEAAAGKDMSNLFNNVLGMFADFLGQLGKMMIAYGVSALAFSILSKTPNPATAAALIIAGGAMVAIGSAITTNMEMASSGNLSGSSGGHNYTAPNYYGGSGSDQLVAKVSGSDLLFIWERASKDKYRIGKG